MSGRCGERWSETTDSGSCWRRATRVDAFWPKHDVDYTTCGIDKSQVCGWVALSERVAAPERRRVDRSSAIVTHSASNVQGKRNSSRHLSTRSFQLSTLLSPPRPASPKHTMGFNCAPVSPSATPMRRVPADLSSTRRSTSTSRPRHTSLSPARRPFPSATPASRRRTSAKACTSTARPVSSPSMVR